MMEICYGKEFVDPVTICFYRDDLNNRWSSKQVWMVVERTDILPFPERKELCIIPHGIYIRNTNH